MKHVPRGDGQLSHDLDPQEKGPQDSCGVFGVWAPGEEVAKLTYFGLYALQHRGQESAGIAVSNGQNVVVYDLARDYATCTRLAVARAGGCTDAAYASAVGALQAAGIEVSRTGDLPGLVVMRTVAMLANEAADAVNQNVASARDVDLAMRNGVNYPLGPLAWADAIGVGHVRAVLANLLAHYGDARYRTSPLLRRNGSLLDG